MVVNEKGELVYEGYDIEAVYRLIDSVGLKPPQFFWQSVYDIVVKKIGEKLLRELFSDWQIAILFCWRTRANCYFCFNQRKAEWVGLLENEPELFWNAEKLEHNGSEYFWNGKDYPLTKIVKEAASIKAKHIRHIFKTILNVKAGRMKQQSLFDFNSEDGFQDYFNTTSCGLFCGK